MFELCPFLLALWLMPKGTSAVNIIFYNQPECLWGLANVQCMDVPSGQCCGMPPLHAALATKFEGLDPYEFGINFRSLGLESCGLSCNAMYSIPSLLHAFHLNTVSLTESGGPADLSSQGGSLLLRL